MGGINWEELKKDYILGDYKSLKIFAEAKGIKYNSNLREKASGWKSDKVTKNRQKADKIVTKTIEKIVEKESNRNARILNLSDKLADKLETAIEQLELYIVTNKKKTKTISYDEKGLKPTKEVIVEIETKDIVDGIIDKTGLKLLSAALKDIKEIQIIPKPEDDTDDTEDTEDDGFIEAMESKVSEVWDDVEED